MRETLETQMRNYQKRQVSFFRRTGPFYIGLCATAFSGKPWKRIRLQLNHGEEVWE